MGVMSCTVRYMLPHHYEDAPTGVQQQWDSGCCSRHEEREDSRAAASGQYRFLLCQECAPRKNQSVHLPALRPSLARLEPLAPPHTLGRL